MVYLEYRYVRGGIIGNIAATGTNPHADTTVCSHPSQTISQALQRATGTTQPALQRDL